MPQQFADHLEAIVLKNPALRQDFNERIDRRHLSAAHLSLLESFASATLAPDLKQGHVNWWHAFTDYMKKDISVLKSGHASLEEPALKQMILFTRWTAQSFANILALDDTTDLLPAYPAEPSAVTSVPVLLAYLEKTLVPALETCLEQMMALPHDQMEQALDKEAETYITQGVPGIEIFHAAPREVRSSEILVPAL